MQAKYVLQQHGIVEMYKGFSPCRLCSMQNNGYSEWMIPYQGIHYLCNTLVEMVHYYLETETETETELEKNNNLMMEEKK
jgi:hypothetical protein